MKKPENSEVEMTLDDSFLASQKAVEVLQLVHREDQTYASELARKHGIDRSTASRILSKLEARRLVERAERDKAIRYTVAYNELAVQTLNITGIKQQRQGLKTVLSSRYRTGLERLETGEGVPTLRDFLLLPIALEPESTPTEIHEKFCEALRIAEVIR